MRNLLLGLVDHEDLRIHEFSYGRTSAKASNLKRLIEESIALPKYISLLLRYRPHIVQIESSFDLKSLMRDTPYMIVARAMGARVVYRSHGGAFDLVPKWPAALRIWTRWLLAFPDRLVLLASAIIRDALAAGAHPSRVVVIPNAIAPFTPDHASTHTDTTSYNLIFAGRLVSPKGALDAVESMQYLAKNNCTLYVFGEGPDAVPLSNRIRDLALGTRVRLMGRVPEQELAEFLRHKGDIFIFPSYHREGFPIALFTAVASGLGIISTPTRPAPDYLCEPDNCLWIPPKQPRLIADAVKRLLDNPQLLALQRKNNRSVGQQFQPGIIASRYRDLYKDVLDRS